MTSQGTDKGYTFCGPIIVDRTMPLKNGLTLETNRQSGVVVSETAGSPLHHATVRGVDRAALVEPRDQAFYRRSDHSTRYQRATLPDTLDDVLTQTVLCSSLVFLAKEVPTVTDRSECPPERLVGIVRHVVKSRVVEVPSRYPGQAEKPTG